jgi:hypothetical protein
MVKLYSLYGDSQNKELKWIVENTQFELDLELHLMQ